MKNPVKFGKYYLLERINVGGMAEVFKAKSFGEAGFERLVAVKRILPSIAEDQEFITMFIDEAKLAVQLTHPNIAQIFELGKVGDAYFISLEYVAGKDLRAIFDRARKRGEPLPIPMACYMVMKICEGLDYAHNKKDAAGRNLELVHRDVSPQNMLISYDGDVKLIDFGIAKAASKSSKTQAGILKGKFGYMSPEQVRGLQIDRRSDIFSLGICLYELLTMERLFVGESDFSTLEKVRNVEIMPPSTYNRKVPEELEQIVLKSLAKHPEDRYRTAMDLHDDLQSFMYTSGNFFARKDLSAYQHRIFQDEIAKEAAKDEEFRKFDSRRASDLDVFEGAAAPPAVPSGRNAPPPPPGPARMSVPPPPPPAAANPQRKATMMGVGMVPPTSRPSSPNGPAVMAAPASAARMAPPPPAPAPAPAAAAQGLEMDWDDEELATQVYDKPENYPGPPPSRAAAAPPVANGHAAQSVAAPASSPAAYASPRAQTAPMPAFAVPAPKSLPPIPAPASMSGPAIGAPPVPAPMPHAAAGYPPPPAHPFNGMHGGPVGHPMALGPNGANGAAAMHAQPMPQAFRMDGQIATAVAPMPERKRSGALIALAGLGVAGVAAAVVLTLGAFRKEPAGNLVVSTNVPGVTLIVDGRPQSGDGMSFAVTNLAATARHHVIATRAGYRSVEQDIVVADGQTLALPLRLDPDAPAIAAAPTTTAAMAAVPVAANPVVAPAPAPVPAAVAVAPVAPSVVAVAAPTPVAVAPAATPQPAPEHTGHSHGHQGHSAATSTASSGAHTSHASESHASSAGSGNASASNSASGGSGFLSISTRPASRCTIAGQSFSTPRLHMELPAGTHRVSCQNPDFNVSGNFTVTIRAGQETREANHPLN